MTSNLPLTVLVHDGPQARAYLVRMEREGLRPERIVVMVADPFTAKAKRPAGLKNVGLLRWAERVQDKTNNHHPYAIRRDHPLLVRAIADAMEPVVPDPMAFYAEMFSHFHYERFADTVIRLPANGYKDPGLVPALTALGVGTVLFTGGGIIPKPVFAIPGISLIHVHTGFLPHVRGADVLLWSLLTRGRPGVAAFFMTPGLDDGDVLATKELAPLAVELPPGPRPDDDTLYRALFSFIDPLIRADLLVGDVLTNASAVSSLAGTPQDLNTGVTFHFMHATVKARALRLLYTAPAKSAHTDEVEITTVGKRGSPPPARYQRYYAKPSVVAPLKLMIDALRANSSLRATSIHNRQNDYNALGRHPERRALHRALNAQLALQTEQWPTYDYGEGWFYQSSDELGITGLRNTTGRVQAFGLADLVRGRTVFEIGCNTGFLSLAIASSADRVVAFELNPYLIAIAEAGKEFLGRTNVAFTVAAFEDMPEGEHYDDVLSFANHHTYDGNTRQSLSDYFERCHAFTKPGGRLIFESHPPELEGTEFHRTLDLIERYYTIERSEVHRYGTFLDQGRRFIVATRR